MRFLILPDTPAAARVAERAAGYAGTVVPHASGRPWIAGTWAPGELAVARSGRRRLALLGHARPAAA
ncbi:asparagine synthase, partial [Spirillospora sp. NPDC029432]